MAMNIGFLDLCQGQVKLFAYLMHNQAESISDYVIYVTFM